MVSKALVKSKLRRIIGFLDAWHKNKYSKDQAKQSCIDLLLKNPY
jgi:hypothetical protein